MGYKQSISNFVGRSIGAREPPGTPKRTLRKFGGRPIGVGTGYAPSPLDTRLFNLKYLKAISVNINVMFL